MKLHHLSALVFSFLLLASVASAETVRFAPSSPTTHGPIDAIVSGTRDDFCVPTAKSVSVSGSTLTLTMVMLPQGCILGQSNYTTIFHLGVLSAGSYTVVLVFEDNGVSHVLAQQAMIVSGAETLRFDPPNVTNDHSVDAIAGGIWRDACLPSVKGFDVAGSTVTLHLNADRPLGVLCAQSTSPYSRTFHLHVLPPGIYNVVEVADEGGGSTELTRAPLIVRDSESIRMLPYAVPVTGGEIAITQTFLALSPTVKIADVPVPVNSSADGLFLVNAPPHAPGAVDVVVTSEFGTVSSKAGLIYYDPASADPVVFEPILFPLSFQGPGAFGSQWTTESFLFQNGSRSFFRDPLPCSGCTNVMTLGSKQLTNDSNPWGHVLYAIRGTTSALDFASRIRDTSRQAQTAGTEVPVARETDFRSQLRFQNVPADARYRATLRLWSLSGGPNFALGVDATPSQQGTLSVSAIPGTSMSFGSLDVTSLLAGGSPTSLTVSSSSALNTASIWGIVSITNNDTQQVTIISPQ